MTAPKPGYKGAVYIGAQKIGGDLMLEDRDHEHNIEMEILKDNLGAE